MRCDGPARRPPLRLDLARSAKASTCRQSTATHLPELPGTWQPGRSPLRAKLTFLVKPLSTHQVDVTEETPIIKASHQPDTRKQRASALRVERPGTVSVAPQGPAKANLRQVRCCERWSTSAGIGWRYPAPGSGARRGPRGARPFLRAVARQGAGTGGDASGHCEESSRWSGRAGATEPAVLATPGAPEARTGGQCNGNPDFRRTPGSSGHLEGSRRRLGTRA